MSPAILLTAIFAFLPPPASQAGEPAKDAWSLLQQLERTPGSAQRAQVPADVRRMLNDGSVDNLRDSLNSGGPTVRGKMTTFGGKFDSGDSGRTASGVMSGSVPGVAVNVDGHATGAGNRSRLNGYWLVKMADGDWIYRQIDLGPGSKPYRKGVRVDLSAGALAAHGYSARKVNSLSFDNVTATYLGKNRSWAAYNGKCVGGCGANGRGSASPSRMISGEQRKRG